MFRSPISKILAFSMVMGGASFAVPAAAQITGTLNAEIQLVDACVVDGDPTDNGTQNVDFGAIDFGQHSSFFSETSATATGGNTGALEIRCTPGVTPILTFDGGENAGQGAGTGDRAMTNGSQFVTYTLFNASTNAPIPPDGTITLNSTGAVETINLSGTAFGEDGLISGTYTDVITVTLTL